MRCLDVQMQLQAYVDGELSPKRVTLLEQHLAGCDGCRAELARLQAVVVALETWPLVDEPDQLTARVMARVRPRPVMSPSAALRTGVARTESHRGIEPSALPAFRLRWSDLAISLAGAGLTFAIMLAWRYLASTSLARLYRAQVVLRLGMLRLEMLLLIQRLTMSGAVTWGLVLAGVTLVTLLAFAVWGLAMWGRGNSYKTPI
ncbi:MAG: zf-HC2 domain-containing protein [Chloroflexota bacterium]|nr:zf-HC2 domain-containing protein [Chloroflexota bacterium]